MRLLMASKDGVSKVKMDDISVRPETTNDFAAIGEMLKLAFPEEDVASLVTNLRQATGYDSELSLVGDLHGAIIGYVMFTPAFIESNKGTLPAMLLAPLAVHPDWQKQGIGSLLTLHGLEQCRRLGNEIVIVIGHSTYYPKFGFLQAGKQGIYISQGTLEESKMVLPLTPGALDGVTGTVRLPAILDGA